MVFSRDRPRPTAHDDPPVVGTFRLPAAGCARGRGVGGPRAVRPSEIGRSGRRARGDERGAGREARARGRRARGLGAGRSGAASAVAGGGPAGRLGPAAGGREDSVPADLVQLALWMAGEYCSTAARALSLVLPPPGRARTLLWAERTGDLDGPRVTDTQQ